MEDYQRILPSTSTKLELDVDRLIHDIVDGVDIPLRTLNQPMQISLDLLPWLAWGRSVDIWHNDWPEWKKRSVTARSYEDHALKGTLAGLVRYLEIEDAELVQIVRPPQGYFAMGTIPKEQWDEYLTQHPKLRVTLHRGAGVYTAPLGWFCDESFTTGDDAEGDYVGLDTGPSLWGRKAFLRKDGQDIPLQLYSEQTTQGTKTGTVLERVVTKGSAGGIWVAGESAAGADFSAEWAIPSQFHTYQIDRQYSHSASRLSLSTVAVGFAPRDTKYYRESDKGWGLDTFFCGDLAGERYATRDDADLLMADVLYLHDPAIAALHTAAMSFAGVSRASMPAHTAEIIVDWKMTEPPHISYFAGVSFGNEDPVANSDTHRRNFLLSAVQLSKRLSDKIGVTFQTTRELTLGDSVRLDGSTALGSSVKNYL